MNGALAGRLVLDGDSGIAVRMDGVDKTYRHGLGSRRRTVALRGCGFELPAGSVTGLVGVNGAGKSTLLAILAGLATADAGTVALRGRSAFVAQDKPVYRHLTADALFALLSRLNQRWDSDRARSWLDRFQVPRDRASGRLSGGQRSQVALAAALGACPDVLLLDEPLAELDPLVRRAVTTELLGRAAETGMTVLLSTHVVSELAGVADHLLVLGEGRTVLAGDVDELLAEHVQWAGPTTDPPPATGTVIDAAHHAPRSRYTVRLIPGQPVPARPEPWTVTPVPLDDLVHAYLAGNREVPQR